MGLAVIKGKEQAVKFMRRCVCSDSSNKADTGSQRTNPRLIPAPDSRAFLSGRERNEVAAAILLSPEHGAPVANGLRFCLLQGGEQHLGINELPLLLLV